jgi:hypothetical protein
MSVSEGHFDRAQALFQFSPDISDPFSFFILTLSGDSSCTQKGQDLSFSRNLESSPDHNPNMAFFRRKIFPNLRRYTDTLLRGLPADSRVSWSMFPKEKSFGFDLHHPTENFFCIHSVDLKNSRATCSSLYVLSKGRGTARTILRNTIPLYREWGIKQADLTASEDGSYAWSRAGYLPKNPRNVYPALRPVLQERLSGFLRQGIRIPQDIVSRAERLSYSTYPQTIWDIADLNYPVKDRPLGYHLLKDFDWVGFLDLHDPDQMARHTAFLERRTAPAVPFSVLRPAARKNYMIYTGR